ncbi:hypothetical protein RP20_CCG011050 [Aedes albopictus]|nr:hypothetical protein RP20_CCG011050 [Aedes albopictus]
MPKGVEKSFQPERESNPPSPDSQIKALSTRLTEDPFKIGRSTCSYRFDTGQFDSGAGALENFRKREGETQQMEENRLKMTTGTSWRDYTDEEGSIEFNKYTSDLTQLIGAGVTSSSDIERLNYLEDGVNVMVVELDKAASGNFGSGGNFLH